MTEPAGRSSAFNLAVNLMWCVAGQVGGSEDYLVRQLLGLASHPPEFVPTLYCLASFADAHPELVALFPVVVAPITGESRPRRVLAEHGWLARRTRGADLVHHGGGTAPRRTNDRFVLTIHDLQYLTYPQYFSSAKLRYLRRVVRTSVSRARVVTVPSDYVKASVVDAFGGDPDRVVVVSHGVDDRLGAHEPDEFALRRDYGLGSGPVLVYPAVTHPHKNHRFLLQLMAEHWTDPELRLVLIGGEGAAELEVRNDIARLGLERRVVRPGRVPAADRDGLLQIAEALVFPSEYEGFGAPVIEAMTLGTPVVCSDRAALPEVTADGGLVLPLDIDAWADVPARVRAEREHLVAAGRRRALRFTAAASGASLIRAYRQAMA
jgi:glycosyltransferase involved in cell wall biosynthesis